MKKAHIIPLALVLTLAVSAGCQANQKSGSAASATADSAETTPEKREIISGFIERKSDVIPQLDLTNAMVNPMENDDYGHSYILKEWSEQNCENFADSMRYNGFESYKNVVDGKIEEFYVYSSDEFYRFSPYEGSLSDLPWEDVKEDDWSTYWCLEWNKTSSTHTGDAPDSQSAFSAIKAYAADYFGGTKYLIDGCLVDETSDALYKSMGLKFCRVCTKPVEDTYAYFDQYLVGKSKAVPVSDICHTFDDRMICDIDADGTDEAVFFDYDMEGDIAYSITVIGVENDDPCEKYTFFVPNDNQFFNVLEQCEEMRIDEKTQAIVLYNPSSDTADGKRTFSAIKVKDGVLTVENQNGKITTVP